MDTKNEGFDSINVEEYKAKIKSGNGLYVLNEHEENSDEYTNFYFIGVYEGREVIYDAVIYTLRLQHESELYEIAEHKAANKFPEFRRIKYEEDENGDLELLDDLEEEIGLFMAEIIMGLEEEGDVKVKEHVEVDPHVDFGVGLDAGLNVEKISHEVIEKFIRDYNDDNLELDDTLYSFETQEEKVG
ncbi:MAG: hypothetical protein AAFX87_28780 [Bacteroidota bacterium]